MYNGLKKIRSFFRHHIYDRKNVIRIRSLAPGYYDTDTRMLHGMFDLLVDFIEVELPWLLFWFEEDKYIVPILGRRRYLLAKWFGIIRCPQLGLVALSNMIKNFGADENKEYHQANSETLALYLWWKDVRSNRKDPSEICGLDKFFEKHGHKIHTFVFDEETNLGTMESKLTEEEEEEFGRLCNLSAKIEAEQYEEDNNMLKRLISLRLSLWT